MDKRRFKHKLRSSDPKQIDFSFDGLIKAVEEGNGYEVDLTLRHKVEVDTTDLVRIPLNIAAAKGYSRISEKLIEAGARIDSEDSSKNTPMLNAAERGHLDVVKLLIRKGANIKTVNTEDRDTVASIAAKGNHIHVLEYLWKDHKEDMLNMRQNTWHKAAQEGRIEVMEWLHQKPEFDINVKNSVGLTPLHFAYDENQFDAVNWLLSHGADPEVRDNKGKKPYDYQLSHDNYSYGSRSLTKSGGTKYAKRSRQIDRMQDDNTDDLKKLNELTDAIKVQSLEKIQDLLIEHEGIVNTSNIKKVPLILASQTGDLDVATNLLNAGAKLSVVDQDGNTALHAAAAKGCLDTMKLLLGRGADVEAVGNSRGTPFHYALRHGCIEIAEYFWANYADKIQKGRPTFLHWAISGQQFEAMEWLVDNLKFLDMNQKNSQGNTPLHFAVACFRGEEKLYKAINYLLEKGADPYIENNEDKTPLDLYVNNRRLGYSDYDKRYAMLYLLARLNA